MSLKSGLILAGFPITLADTAGLRESHDDIEIQGVGRTRQRASDADVKLAVFSADMLDDPDSYTRALIDDTTLVVVNKIDLVRLGADTQIEGHSVVGVSANTGENIDTLTDRLIDVVGARLHPVSGAGDISSTTSPGARELCWRLGGGARTARK